MIHKKKEGIKSNLFRILYIDLNNTIKNINTPNEDLDCPPSISNKIITSKSDTILKEMNDFLKLQLKNQYKELNSYLQVIQENILGRKIRISFIGPISVGKSTVLNYIIGQQILPSNKRECTY